MNTSIAFSIAVSCDLIIALKSREYYLNSEYAGYGWTIDGQSSGANTTTPRKKYLPTWGTADGRQEHRQQDNESVD